MKVAVETAFDRAVFRVPLAEGWATLQSYLVLLVFVAQGVGLLLVAAAHTVARGGSTWGDPLFWVAMSIIWVPATVIIVRGTIPRRGRIALVAGTGVALYLVKVLETPLSFDPHDELLHWRTARDMVATEQLFNENSMLPVSPLYPGLEIATTALVKLTGLSTYLAGTVLVGIARFIMVLALYLLYERIGRSSWLASVAAMVYMANPKFMYFDASYAYESLALPLALGALCLLVRWQQFLVVKRLALAIFVGVLVVAVSATHHVTSFILAGVLTLLAIVSFVIDEGRMRMWFSAIAAFALAVVLIWMFFVAGDVVGYLAPTLGAGVTEVIELIRREGSSRELFTTYAGESPPVWDRIATLAFTGITVLCLPVAWFEIWRKRRLDPWIVVFVFGSLVYPASGLFRFTKSGAEAADRSSAFVFVAVAFLFALALAAFRAKSSPLLRTSAATVVICVLLYGGFGLGGPRWARNPGPYLVAADARSVERESLASAAWAREHLGSENRIASDRVNRLLMFAYGQQRTVTTLADDVDVSPLFFSSRVFDYERALIRRANLEYLVVDYRLTRQLPMLGVFYDSAEPRAFAHTAPIAREAYDKFDRVTRASRTFDSGNIVVYDVSQIATIP